MIFLNILVALGLLLLAGTVFAVGVGMARDAREESAYYARLAEFRAARER